MKQSISSLVDGGSATPGPPLGPALGQLKVNVGAVVAAINEATKEFAGMKVPVTILVDTATKEFEIKVGSPPTSALIKKELGIEKGSGEAKSKVVANMSLDQAKKIAGMKRSGMLAASMKAAVKEVLGACVSMGVTVEGKPAKDLLKEIEGGLHDAVLQEN